MNRNILNSDVWVIHQETACLFRQQDSVWTEELKMPFVEFSGSATALSSFSQTDTEVYLNVGLGISPPGHKLEQSWAGIAVDPSRLVDVPLQASHKDMLKELKVMGKTATVIASGQAQHFQHATRLALLEATELKLLKQRLQQEKQGSGSKLSGALFCLRLWLVPKTSYQVLRAVAVACILTGGVLTHLLNDVQARHREIRSIQQTQKNMRHETEAPQLVQFSLWEEQIRKFGQAERANIRSLRMSWSESGNVHTQVDLIRERKRVPKGCKLVETTLALCTTGEAAK